MDWTNILFSFGGRLNRAKYWLVVLLNAVVWVAFMIAAITTGGLNALYGAGMGGSSLVIILLGIAVGIFSVWTGLATAIKRLHDREKSGWWILVFWILPGILNAAGMSASDITAIVLAIASFAISIWGFVEIACLKGTTGPNNYGPDPLPADA